MMEDKPRVTNDNVSPFSEGPSEKTPAAVANWTWVIVAVLLILAAIAAAVMMFGLFSGPTDNRQPTSESRSNP